MLSLLEVVLDTMRSTNQMPWQSIKEWQPFKIDALGLVTLLGADEVNQSVGMLQRRRLTEYLPLLAAFVVAGDRFNDDQAGFSLYNLTDGIHSTELKGWFTRWLSLQKINNATTVFHWDVLEKSGSEAFSAQGYTAILISLVCVVPLLACTVLIGDWFGVGNAASIVASIVVRASLLSMRRHSIDALAKSHEDQRAAFVSSTDFDHSEIEKGLDRTTTAKALHRAGSAPTPADPVKLLATRADGKLVTLYVRRSILPTMVRDVNLFHPRVYHSIRWLGWAAFGAHICILGMSSLFTQIYTVSLLVACTWLLCSNLDIDVGRTPQPQVAIDGTGSVWHSTSLTAHIGVRQEDPAGVDRRMLAFARLRPTERQEMMLKHWSLLPFEGSGSWYADYNDAKEANVHRTEKSVQVFHDISLTQPHLRSSGASSLSSSAHLFQGAERHITPAGK
ncbi:hypothetical protein LTR10_003462 [Elasticomyces elasticus]|nr:hypothetical protein LTR10_003462 [Elasticomyces elasticus]KAK4969730.1 hypothetical protein LTR42_009002 [Elasticomyces elasticus]